MKPFENIAGKGENAGNRHFLLFPQCFLLCQRQKSSVELVVHLHCCLQLLSIWFSTKFCLLVKGEMPFPGYSNIDFDCIHTTNLDT